MKSIAIIEDSKSISALYRTFLDDSQYHLKFFSSTPRDTLELKKETGVAIVICPGFPKHQDGAAIVNALKALKPFQNTKFIVSTTMTSSQLTADWNLSDIDGLLIKPFTKEKLGRAISKVASTRRQGVRKTPLAMVVDDSKATVTVLEKHLKKMQFNVKSASNGKEGLRLIKEVLPDIIITDVEMPELDGFELCKRLSDNWETNHIPVIVTSSAINYDQFKKGFGAGASHFIQKPISFSQLYSAVNAITTVKDLGPVITALVMSASQTTLSIILKELQSINIHLNICADFDELIGYMAVTKPDIIIADLSDIPDDKLEKTQTIKMNMRENSSILIVIADNNDLNTIMNCLTFGANDFLTKPFLSDELRLRIENHIRMKNLQDELIQKTKMLEILAYKDGLTNLMNRRFFDINLRRALNSASKENRCVSLLLMDLDNFKEINDNFGHEIGDMVLMEVGDIIHRKTQKAGIACRYGGEEFSVILPDTDINKALKISEEIRRECSKQLMTYKEIEQTLSIGGACFPETSPADRLLSDADKSLYRAKALGKNLVIGMEKGCSSGPEKSDAR